MKWSMKFGQRMLQLVTVSVMVLWGAQLSNAQGTNIAPDGSPVFGYHDLDDNSRGTDYEHAGPATNINDGNVTTRSDTWGGIPASVPYDYAGVEWSSPQPNIRSIHLTMSTFLDGGWFGTPLSAFPPQGKALEPSDLLAPRVQFSVDGGSQWFDWPGVTDNYVAQMTGHNIGGGGFPNPSTSPTVVFNLPELGIAADGVRLFGEGGGYAGADSTGFIGVFELEVYQVPEPASLGLMAGTSLLMLIGRRRKLALLFG